MTELETLTRNVDGLLDGTDRNILDENSNKNSQTISTQRDLIAGEVSKIIGMKNTFPKEVIQAHNSGMIHIHDSDYVLSKGMINCCLPNFKDMLLNGTVVNNVAIESPKSFHVACTVLTQLIAGIASSQYGGQSANNFPEILAPFVARSREKHQKFVEKLGISGEQAQKTVEELLAKEVKDGIQTIQYQINTLMGTNGQSPFLTLFLNFDPNGEYAQEAAMVTEEILRQRIQGVKNENGVYVTPAFPKLVYVLDEHNIHPNSPYYYLTELAAESTSKRMYPDYISAPLMRKNYEGNVFSPMGCRSFLSPFKNKDGEYQFEGRFNKGVVTVNLPNVGLTVGHDEEAFFDELDRRLEDYVKPALIARHNFVASGSTSSSPLHWCYGALARLPLGEPIPDYYLTGKYSTLSIGYIGIEEACRAVLGEAHTTEKGTEFALKIMEHLNSAADRWNEEYDYGFSVYGTPAESLTDKACRKDSDTFGVVEGVNDRGFYTNSYHVHVEEPIDVFSKFSFENQFQSLSAGGCISYVELPDITRNLDAMLALIKYGYENIQYFEFNLRSLDVCNECKNEGIEAKYNADKDEWFCPICGNSDPESLSIIRRSCGYLGANRWIQGRSKEIDHRVQHI